MTGRLGMAGKWSNPNPRVTAAGLTNHDEILLSDS
jgi:hypothetical protein